MTGRIVRILNEWRLDPLRGMNFLGDWVLLPVAAQWRRRNHSTTFIGITGSGGKTTTKELVSRVLSSRYSGTASIGSRNRSAEVSRVLFSTRPAHDYCVQELGAFGPGTLDALIAALYPQVGVVTAVAREHYATFRGIDAVEREKAKLIRALPSSGTAVINVDDPRVREMAELSRAQVITIGSSSEAELRAVEATSSWPDGLRLTVEYAGTRVQVQTRLLGTHWTTAVLAALATGIAMEISLEDGAEALDGAEPSSQRLSVEDVGDGIVFIRDDYNAATWTIPAALEALSSVEAQRRFVVLGQLADDPKAPRVLYPQTVRAALEIADHVILVGKWAKYGLKARVSPDDRRVVACETVLELSTFLDEEWRRGDVVLVKAAGHIDHLERLVLSRSAAIRCWKERCGRQNSCSKCRLRSVDSSP